MQRQFMTRAGLMEHGHQLFEDYVKLLRDFSLVKEEQIVNFVQKRPLTVLRPNQIMESSYDLNRNEVIVNESRFLKLEVPNDVKVEAPALELVRYTELAVLSRAMFHALTGALLNSFEYNKFLSRREFGKEENALLFFVVAKVEAVSICVAKLFQNEAGKAYSGTPDISEMVDGEIKEAVEAYSRSVMTNLNHSQNDLLHVIAYGDALDSLCALDPESYTLQELRDVLSRPIQEAVTAREVALYMADQGAYGEA